MKFSQKFVTYHGCGSCYVDGRIKKQIMFFSNTGALLEDPEQTELQDQQEINYKRKLWQQEATVKYILIFYKKLNMLILLFSINGQVVQKTIHTIAMTVNLKFKIKPKFRH